MSTLPFAPFALRELAEHWQRQLSEGGAPSELGELRTRLLQLYLQIVNTDPDADVRRQAGERALSMLDAGPIEAAILEGVAEIAAEDENTVLYRRVLELLASSENTEVQRRALERLGDLFEQLGNRRAAADSWKPAAHMLEDTRWEREHARRLYERTLDTLPDDHEAAEQLVQLYADSDEWSRVPEVMGVVIRADGGGAADLLLRIAPNALTAGARDEVASMVDEVLALLPPWSARVRDLLRVKARALADLPTRHAQASETYRALIQAFGSEADRRDYEAFIASRLDADERHRERRWLYPWRAANEAQPAGALLAWATEEEEHGEIELATTILRRLLADAPDRKDALEALCRVRVRASDFMGAFEALEALTSASAAEERPALGRRMAGLVGTCAATMAGGLPVGLSLFERVERVGRDLGQIDAIVLSYGHVLTEQEVDSPLAAALGGRLAALEGESSIEASFFIEALTKVLELVPGARWALDRVKLTLVLQARWDAFFRLYDRAVEATKSERERAELLGEAAFAARDVADDAYRAGKYLDALCELRPDDETASAARRRVQRRVAVLRLDGGEAAEASATVEAMLEGGADVADVSDLLERLARHPGQGRAVERLLAHYEGLGRIGDCVRVADAALDLADAPDLRKVLARDLVRLRVSAAKGAPSVFARAMAHVESDLAKRPALAATIHRAVLRLAIAASKRAPTDADFLDATDGAWRALDASTRLLLEAGDVKGACRLLYRGARLPFERPRRRELLRRAVELWADVLGDSRAAIRLLDEIFQDDPADAIAVGLLGRFAGLLRGAGQEERVARLWEDQAGHRARAGNEAEQGACWRLAAEAWERQGSVDRAIAAYERGAALGSEESFEGLARIHTAHGRWPEAAAALEWIHGHSRAPGRDRRALRLATAYVELDRSDRARACLEQVLCSVQELEDAEAVRTQLVALYRRDSVWRPLVDMLSMLASTTEDRDQRVALFHEASEILRSKLDAPAEAADLLDLAVASDPGDVGMRLELAGVLEGLEQWSRAAKALEDRIALFGDQRSKERALLHHRLARALVRAADLTGALEQLRLASRMQPAHPAILHDLGRVAFDAGDVDLAEKTYRALLLALRHPAEPYSTVSSAAVLLELGAIAHRRGNVARAADLVDSALESALDSGEDARPFERALRDMGRNDLLARTLMRHAERASDVAARAVALRDLVDLWKSDLGRESALGARLGRCAQTLGDDLEREPSADGEAWAALWSIHDALGDEASLLGRGNRLAPVLEAAIGRMDPGADRARLRVALARMLAAQPARAAAAAALLSSAREEGPADGTGDPPGYLDAVWRVGDALERAEDPKGAARLYESILDRRPADRETARTLVLRLEALGSDRLADGIELCMALEGKAGRGLAERLVALRDAQADAAGVVRALEMVFAADPGNGSAPEDRALLRRLVVAYDALGAGEKVLGLLDRALGARPSDGELATMRAGARERSGDVDGAVSDLLGVGADDGAELEVALSMLERIFGRSTPAVADAHAIGWVDLLIRAKRRDQARRELEALLARAPGHTGGLERMASLAAADEAWDQAVEVYGRLVRECSDPACLARVVSGLAHACERAGRPADAREPLEAALRLLPASADLGRALERVYELTGDWTHLATLLAARAERAPEVAEKVALLLRAATVLVEHSGQPSSALPLIEQARAVHPESIEATLAWAKLQAASGRPREAVEALQDVARRSRGKRSAALAGVYLEIGKAHLADDELVEALEALKAGFAIEWQRGELAILVGLVALDLGEEKTAERALLAVAMAAPRKEGSSAGAAPADKVKAFYHLAAMAHAKGDLAKARRWVTKAVSEDPAHDGARALLRKLDSHAVRVNVASQ